MCLFHKGFCTVYVGAKEDNAVTLPHSAATKHAFMVNSMESSKKNPKKIQKEKIALEWLHQRLGHKSTRSLITGDTANVWEDVELKIDPDPFCTSCKISSMNKKARSKLLLKPKAPFKKGFYGYNSIVIKSLSRSSLYYSTTIRVICNRQALAYKCLSSHSK